MAASFPAGMKKLFQVFIELPTLEGVFLIVAAGGFVLIVALIVSRISFRAGVRFYKCDVQYRKLSGRSGEI